MTRQEKVLEKKKLGRPAIGKGVQLNTMARPDLVAGLDRFIGAQPDPMTRPEAIRHLLRDHLVGMGFIKASSDDPEMAN